MNRILQDVERNDLIPEVAIFTEGRPGNLTPVIPLHHVIRIQTAPVPDQYAFHVVTYCELSAWLEDPALIMRLLNRWSYLPNIDLARTRLTALAPKNLHGKTSVWDTCQVALGRPFLGREETRRALENFTYDLEDILRPGVGALIVRGTTGSGKTFTYEYIRYANAFTNRFNILWVDFNKQVARRFGPIELVEDLLYQVHPDWRTDSLINIPVQDTQQPSRWMLELARFLLDVINNRRTNLLRYLLILDGFDDIRVPRETIDFVQVLVSVAVGAELAGESNDVLRVALLGFKDPIPNYRNRVRVDDIKPVSRKDIEAYFTNYASFKNKKLDTPLLTAMADKLDLTALNAGLHPKQQIAHECVNVVMDILND